MSAKMSTHHRRKSLGLCARCGCREPLPPYITCSLCREKDRERRDRAHEKGICVACFKNPAPEGRKVCRQCTSRGTARKKARAVKDFCVTCAARPKEKDRSQCGICRARTAERGIMLKEMAYSAYGGYRCACCGETERSFLTIDHVNNDGNVHRKQMGVRGRGSGTNNLYAWLHRYKYPSGFQILCRNCNWSKHVNGGKCAHLVCAESVDYLPFPMTF